MSASTETFPCVPRASRRTVARFLRAAAIGATLSVTTLAATAIGPAPAAEASRFGVAPRMEINAMAPVVTASARDALAAYENWTVTSDPAAYRAYVWYRTQAAQFAATELGYSQADMAAAWARAPIDHQRAVLAAMTQLGVPYRTNTSKEGVGFDCSGLTTYAWARADVTLIRQSSAQIREAAPRDRSTAKAGDLVQYPGHVMMYLGVGDAVVHSVQRGRTVELDLIHERRSNTVRFGDPS